MFSLGFGEIFLVALIALIFIGPEQLPEVARVVARLLNEWKRATSDLTGTLTDNLKEDIKGRIEEVRRDAIAAETPPPPPGSDITEKIEVAEISEATRPSEKRDDHES